MRRLIVLALLFITTISTGQVLSERDRATVIDEVLADRFNNLLPKLMDRADIDMWVVISREYNEDPVLKTMLPSTWLNARRRTILVFYRDKEANTIEKLAVARYNVGKNIISAWDKEKQPDQWQRLLEIIEKRNPSKIGLIYSDNYGLADGIVKTDYDAFISRLTAAQQAKVVSAEQLAVGWLETRTALEVGYFEQLVDITHDIIKDAFSAKVIT
ncbi:MAG: Xaa-Pro aminopeptidase, partial [Dokdonia donghaensis]|nr:Xaa-Pro aminopeptidase [Dokdonia donghaensis]